MSFRLYLAGFDIGSIETRHGPSAKLSNSLGDDDGASRFIIPLVREEGSVNDVDR